MHTVSICLVSWFTSPIMLESSASVFFTKTVSKESCDTFHEEEMLHNVWHTQHHKMTQFFSRWCQPNKNKSDSHYVFLPSLNMIIKFSLMHISLWTPSWAGFNMYSALIEKCCHLTKKNNKKKIKTIITMYNYKLDTSWTLFLEHEVAISNGLSTTS